MLDLFEISVTFEHLTKAEAARLVELFIVEWGIDIYIQEGTRHRYSGLASLTTALPGKDFLEELALGVWKELQRFASFQLTLLNSQAQEAATERASRQLY